MRPASWQRKFRSGHRDRGKVWSALCRRSEEHTSELQSPCNLVCRLLLEKKKIYNYPLRSRSPIASFVLPRPSLPSVSPTFRISTHSLPELLPCYLFSEVICGLRCSRFDC